MEREASELPIAITPELHCKWRWINRQALACNLDEQDRILFGPDAPNGNEANWVPTEPGKNYFLFFRFYGPEKSFYNKSWQLADMERMGN